MCNRRRERHEIQSALKLINYTVELFLIVEM